MIRYDRLWAIMEMKHMTQYRLIRYYNFSAGQIGRLKKNMHVSTRTLDTLCSILGCSIEDIVEYVPDSQNAGQQAFPSDDLSPEQIPASDDTEPSKETIKGEKSAKTASKKNTKSKKQEKKTGKTGKEKDGKKGRDGKKGK